MPPTDTATTELALAAAPKTIVLNGDHPVAPTDKGAKLDVLPDEAYLPFFSERAKNIKGNPIRDLLPMEYLPGMLSLLAGKPNPETFPITSVTFNTRHPSGDEVKLTLTDGPLHEAMQYNLIQGLPALTEWVTGLQEFVHGRKREEGWTVSMGVGSADLLHKCVNGLFDSGDSILVETPSYPGIIPLFHSLNVECVEVASDPEGIQPDDLAKVLNEWPEDKPKPKALYTIPVGSNPSGYTTTLERRRQVLALAHKHNFLILEDDPYYYLYYAEEPRPPSYFTLEAIEPGPAGRVVRFDSFSKILSSGFRLGFVTGPAKIMAVINGQTALSNLQPSTFVQGIVLSILQSWGYETFLAHTERVSEFYKKKRDVFISALERHLGPLGEWHTPGAGMFLWLKLNVPPNADGEIDSAQVIKENARNAGILALPGVVASPLGKKSAYSRVSFSLLSEEDADEAARRLAKVVIDCRNQAKSS